MEVIWRVVKRRKYGVEYTIEVEVDGVVYSIDAAFDDKPEADALCGRLADHGLVYET